MAVHVGTVLANRYEVTAPIARAVMEAHLAGQGGG